jgi:hypothetical protein
MALRNVGNRIPKYTVVCPRRPKSKTLLCSCVVRATFVIQVIPLSAYTQLLSS